MPGIARGRSTCGDPPLDQPDAWQGLLGSRRFHRSVGLRNRDGWWTGSSRRRPGAVATGDCLTVTARHRLAIAAGHRAALATGDSAAVATGGCPAAFSAASYAGGLQVDREGIVVEL
jgi:hypothetical protein